MDVHPVILEGHTIRLVPMALKHLDGLCAVGLEPELWRWTPAGPTHQRATFFDYRHPPRSRHPGIPVFPDAIPHRRFFPRALDKRGMVYYI